MSANNEIITVTALAMKDCFTEILLKEGFEKDNASVCADIFTANSIDGIYSHGVNRFARFIKYVRDGFVNPAAVPTLQHAFAGIEQWNGNLGPGTLNALHATKRVMQLAMKHAIGCVALSNTNHWMRAGNYGWHAAKAGYVFIGWTNTTANMPAWGAIGIKLGNNPLVMALPYKDEAIVLDMAMSQFSVGQMEMTAMKNEKLSVNGGFDKNGNLTNDPSDILATRRLLPIGYWKGSGLALLLDLLATILSGGLSTSEISKENAERGLSQVFIAIDISKLSNQSSIKQVVENIITDYHGSIPADESQKITYPGERVLQTKQKNIIDGIPVLKKVWDTVLELQNGTADLTGIRYT